MRSGDGMVVVSAIVLASLEDRGRSKAGLAKRRVWGCNEYNE